MKKITSRLPAVPHKTLFCLLVIGQTFFPASDSFAQSVPARAQKAFERGKIAAKGRNWRLAIKYFTQARKAAPRAPVFLYALGNAHNETRHPVLAAVYFQAYLEAFPKAPNAQRVRQNILEQEVFLDRLVEEIYGEALSTVKRLPKRWARQEARLLILESMARAGELDEAERIGRLNPEGAPKALAALALKIAQARFREKAAVEPGVNPVALFALSVKLSKSEAVSAAKNFNVPWNFICAPGPGCTDRKAVLKRKWKKEQSRREALREAETLIALAFQMKKAGLHGSAYAAVQRGVRLAERSGMPDKFHCERSTWEEELVVTNSVGCEFYGAKGKTHGIGKSKNGIRVGGLSRSRKNFAPKLTPSGKTSWLKVLEKGRAPYPAKFSLDDPVFSQLAALVRNQKKKSIENLPLGLAKLAEKLARARNFLRRESF